MSEGVPGNSNSDEVVSRLEEELAQAKARKAVGNARPGNFHRRGSYKRRSDDSSSGGGVRVCPPGETSDGDGRKRDAPELLGLPASKAPTGAGNDLEQLRAQVLNSMPGREGGPSAATAAAASRSATGINGALAAALEGEGGKADSNPLRALEKQSKRGLESETRNVSGSFCTYNAMKMTARKSVAQKLEKTRSVCVFEALLHPGGLVMNKVAGTSAVGHLIPMVKIPEREKTEAEGGVTTASRATRPMTSTARCSSCTFSGSATPSPALSLTGPLTLLTRHARARWQSPCSPRRPS